MREGEKLKFECGVSTGNPKPFTIEWWHNNAMLSSKRSNFEAPLVFNATLRKDKGVYRCIAKNDAGQDSYDINLDVQCKSFYHLIINHFPFSFQFYLFCMLNDKQQC